MGRGMLAAVLAMLVSPGGGAWPVVTQTSVVQGVTVAVTPGNLEPDSGVWDFAIAFDAPGRRRLDDPLLHNVVLVGDGRRVAPLAWEGQPPALGHRAGVLRFLAIQPRPRQLQLEITRPGESRPRVFRFVFGEWSA